ncbi:molybdopterin-synthase adenylyltransferase MoeB [Coralloluteibacterium stylophorae]|uniref:Molybdopterin-synthase adenylyltransferase n=1 Tax=Coralloluteibacterium stylophorae TaxID=1776034 RepID=A0AAP2C965_9GAMM|nr:molybdopterin-synthase adenylyltransferase MoeB [Coralloluteibacterium stylophorae]MBS7455961.1 molybdopterin-synthase adenylyltransferase MoeB [Coralloluteibacterium stylophorae]
MADIIEILPAEASARQQAGAVLVDVREVHEQALGMARGALGVARASLEATPARWLPDPHAEVLLICQTGGRSAQAAATLQAAGYGRVASVAGGTTRWQAEGLPLDVPEGDLDFHERYSRQLRLPEVGPEGQRRLEAARVVLIGAGGLGSPAAYYLAAAGVGTLVLADDDVVDRSNLQRQILHTEARIGVAKVDSAAAALAALNPRTRIETHPLRVRADNVEALIATADVVIDGADNFAARYLLNDACVKLGKPLVYGAVHRFDGQASVFDAGRRRGQAPCYRCLFPEPPPPEAAPNCAEAGVLGIVPGVIGLLQATEAIKLVLGLGETLSGRLLHFDALRMRFRETRLPPDSDCPVCAPGRAFPGYIDYAAFCAGG